MIRWARQADEQLPPHPPRAEDWRAAWTARWSAVTRRGVIVLTAETPQDLSQQLRYLPRSAPGTRLVLTCRTALHEHVAAAAWPDAVGLTGWAPELPHCSDPWPGDPHANSEWATHERIMVDVDGAILVGAVLSRRLQPEELSTTVLGASAGWLPSADHFPLPDGSRLPVPAELREWATFSPEQVAEAFGLRVPDAAPLIDELLASGALRVISGTGSP